MSSHHCNQVSFAYLYNEMYAALPHALLHVSSQNDMPIRARSRNHIRLVVSPMTHNVPLHARRLYKHHLATGWITLGIFHAGQRPCRDAGAVDDDLGGGTGVCCLDAGKPLSHKMYSILVSQPVEEVLNVLGSIQRQGGEGYAEPNARRKLLRWQLFELRLGEHWA